jgi:hypothetical protein
LRGRKPVFASVEELQRLVFRNMFLEERDMEIADILFNYFEAVRRRWPDAWVRGGNGAVLHKTNGFRALMRLLRPLYLQIADPGESVTVEDFFNYFLRSNLQDDDFVVDNFKPGTSGETALYRQLGEQLGLI